MSRDLYDELKELAASAGLSPIDILKSGMEKAQTATEGAFVNGYVAGSEEYEVTCSCAACGKRHLSVDTEEQIETAAKLMTQAGWHGRECR